MNTYITQQGDSWDLLAYLFWGSEYLMTDLVEANQQYRHYIEFPNGIELTIPEIEIDDESEIPEWLSEDDSDNEDEDDPTDEIGKEGLEDDENNEIN